MSEYRGDEYFVNDNGTLMHYGVKGMKWKNHKYVNGNYGVNQGYTKSGDSVYVPREVHNGRATTNAVRTGYIKPRDDWGQRYHTEVEQRKIAAQKKHLEDTAAKNREAIARGARVGFQQRANAPGRVGDKRKRYANENQGFAEFVKNDIKDRAYDAKWALKRAGVNAKAKARAGLYKAGRAWKNGLGGEIRRTADRFVSDTADFYRNKAGKARKALRNAARGLRGGIDDTVESIVNKFKKKRR